MRKNILIKWVWILAAVILFTIVAFFFIRFFIDYKTARLLDADNGFGEYKCEIAENLYINTKNELIERTASNVEAVILSVPVKGIYQRDSIIIVQTLTNRVYRIYNIKGSYSYDELTLGLKAPEFVGIREFCNKKE